MIWRDQERGWARRWLDWGLLAYLLLLTAIGIAIVRLAINHRRFDPLTITQTEPPQAD